MYEVQRCDIGSHSAMTIKTFSNFRDAILYAVTRWNRWNRLRVICSETHQIWSGSPEEWPGIEGI